MKELLQEELDKEFLNFIETAEKTELSKYRNLVVAERQTRKEAPERQMFKIESEEELAKLFHKVIDPGKAFFKGQYIFSAICALIQGVVVVLNITMAIRQFLSGNWAIGIFFLLLAALMIWPLDANIKRLLVSRNLFEQSSDIDIDNLAKDLFADFLQEVADMEGMDSEEVFWNNALTQVKIDSLRVLEEKQHQLDVKLGLG